MRGLRTCLAFSPGGSGVRAVCGRGCALPWCPCRPGLRGKACGPVRTLSASHPASASQALRLAPGIVATVLCAPPPVWSVLDPLPWPLGPAVLWFPHPVIPLSVRPWAAEAFAHLPCVSGAYRRGWRTCPAGRGVGNDVYSFHRLKKVQTKNDIYDIQMYEVPVPYMCNSDAK